MRIIEIFHSLQGEGPWIGMPCVFIRLAGCVEPYCEWCDTKYALDEGFEAGIDEIIGHLKAFACNRIVVTGGEPFVQQDAIKVLHDVLIENSCLVQYETSGKAGIPHLENSTIVLSPKRHEGRWLVSSDDVARADFVKFVYESAMSCDPIFEFISQHKINPEKVYIMPLGANRQQQLALMSEVFEFCRVCGFNMTPRLHILCFDEKRGI